MTDEEWQSDYVAAKAASDKALDAYGMVNPQDIQADAAAWQAVKDAQARQRRLLDERDVRRGVALCEVKALADMTDDELQLELDRATIQVEAAWEDVAEKHGKASQEVYAAAIAAREAASERFVAAHEVAIARGWYSLMYTDPELAEIATTRMIVLDVPGEGAMNVNIGHIAEGHGDEAVQAVRTGGWKKGDCNGGEKAFAYKLADDGRYWLRISWHGDVVTCFRCTWDYLCYCFKIDGCNPPRPPSHHDLMSSPAY